MMEHPEEFNRILVRLVRDERNRVTLESDMEDMRPNPGLATLGSSRSDVREEQRATVRMPQA